MPRASKEAPVTPPDPVAPADRVAPTRLTVLYDERCALCRRARDWLLTQPCLVQVELLPAGSIEAEERYGGLPWLGHELAAVDENGNAWVGPNAFIACMWATVRYRGWAFRLSRPSLAPHAERFFRWVSKRRDRFGSWVTREDEECSWCDSGPQPQPRSQRPVDGACTDGHPMTEGQRYCVVCGRARFNVQMQG